MKNWRRLVFAVWSLLGFVALSETVDLLVLQTADIHGCVGTPCSEEQGDWLKLATVIRRKRREHGPERTLLIDCGDTCQGSLAATLTEGEIILPLLASLRYDVWVPGNHELDFGCARLAELAASVGNSVLCGNMELQVGKQNHSYAAWRMFDRGGARIAVIGATASYMRHWFVTEQDADFKVWRAKRMLEEVLPDIMRRDPDVVILAAHQGWLVRDPRGVNELKDIGNWFPEIDLILGGHTHRLMPGIAVGPDTWYVQPGAKATHVAAIRLTVDTDRHRVLETTSELIACGDTVDRKAGKVVAEMLHDAEIAARRHVCSLDAPVTSRGRPGVSCATSDLICRALAAETGAPWILHGRLSRADLPKGPVTETMLFELVPYENRVVVADVTADELETIVTEQLQNRHSYVYCGIWGAQFQIHGGDAGNKLGYPHVTMTRKPEGTERRPLAMNSYTAAGGGGRFPKLLRIVNQRDARKRVVAGSTREVVRAYLKAHADEPVKAERWIRGTLATFDR